MPFSESGNCPIHPKDGHMEAEDAIACIERLLFL
jgi:hypothetical protein